MNSSVVAHRLFGLTTGLLLWSRLAAAQSVSPPIAEYKERARSSFQLSNGSLFPVTAVLEVKGFDITDRGEVVDLPIDSTRLHVKLSAMSFRIPARGAYTVFYEANGDTLPAWFNVLSAMSGLRSANGLNVRVLLPHVVYLNQKQPLKKADVAVRKFEFDPAAGKARVQLENLSGRLGRVLELKMSNEDSGSQPGGGFPLLPLHQRWVEVAWDGARPPERLTLRFAGFTIDTALAAIPGASTSDSSRVVARP
jgi:hypothetical protein